MIKTIQHKNLTWYNIEKPNEEDVKFLKANFNFHPLLLKELTLPTRRTKIEKYDGYLYLVFHIPVFDKKTRFTGARELDILITQQAVITAYLRPIIPLNVFWDQCNLYEESREQYMGGNVGKFIYYLIDYLIVSYFPKLEHIIENVDSVERKIFEGKEKFLINEISYIKRDILSFRSIVKSQFTVFESFAKISRKFFNQSDIELYFEDLIGDYARAVDVIDNQKELIEALEKTNETLFYFKLNDTLKILTIFSVILLPVTMLFNLYGMNISYLPFSESRFSFLWIIFLSLLIATIMLYYFRRKKWI